MTEPIDRPSIGPDGPPARPDFHSEVVSPAVPSAASAAALPVAAVSSNRGGGPSRILDLLLALAAAVAIAGVAFAIGRMTAPTGVSTGLARGGFAAGGGVGSGGGFGRAGRGGVLAIQGSVVAVTSDHLTLKLASGQTVQIPLSTTTAYHRSGPATVTDVATGSQVLVQFAPRVPGSPNQGSGGGGQAVPGQSPAAPGQGEPRFLSGAATDVTVVGQ